MTSTVDAVFGLAFLSQIVVLSLLWPRALARRLGGVAPAYISANRALAALGLVVLALLFTLEQFESLRATLLAIGLYFFLQLSTLALVRSGLGRLSGGSALPQDSEVPGGPIGLFDLVSPVAVAIAVTMLLIYAAAELFLADELWGLPILKVAILTAANAFFAALVAWNLRRARGAEPETRAERIQELRKAAPMLAYISIGLSVYFFGKDVIAVVGFPRLRLVMMSLFLQLLGSLAYSRLLSGSMDVARHSSHR